MSKLKNKVRQPYARVHTCSWRADIVPPLRLIGERGWMALVCLLLCSMLYGWTVGFPMVFDDFIYMVDNPFFARATAFGYLGRFFEFARLPLEVGADPDLTANMLLRPVAYATFYLNYALDGFEPHLYRVANIGVHALNGWLVFCLIHTLGRVLASQCRMSCESSRFIAASTSLLFIVHPLATESVTYIIQRFTSMGAALMLGCLVMHFSALENLGRRRCWLRTASVTAALLGMLTKESAVLVPVLALVLDCLVIGTRLREAAVRAVPLLLCLPVVPMLVLAVSAAQNGGQLSLGEAINISNVRGRPWTHWQYAATQCTVLVEYLRLIVWPTGQNVYPDPPVYDCLQEGPVWRAVLLLAGLTGGTWWLRGRPWMGGAGRLASAFVAWFFISISVSSSIIPLPDMMAEHRAYLPSIGVLAALMCVVERLSAIPGFMPARGLVGSAVCALAAATCLRNEIWRTNRSLWEDTVAKSPRKAGAWNNLGCARLEEGDLQGGEDAFRRSLELEPFYFGSLNNLSKALLMMQRWKECHETLVTLFEKHPAALKDRQIVSWAGVALVGMGRHQEGGLIFERMLKDEPGDFIANKFLGLARLHQKQFGLAREYLLRAEALKPGDLDVTEGLAMLQREKAMEAAGR